MTAPATRLRASLLLAALFAGGLIAAAYQPTNAYPPPNGMCQMMIEGCRPPARGGLGTTAREWGKSCEVRLFGVVHRHDLRTSKLKDVEYILRRPDGDGGTRIDEDDVAPVAAISGEVQDLRLAVLRGKNIPIEPNDRLSRGVVGGPVNHDRMVAQCISPLFDGANANSLGQLRNRSMWPTDPNPVP